LSHRSNAEGDPLPDPIPILAAEVRRGESLTALPPRPDWDARDLVEQAARLLEGDMGGGERSIEVSGKFAGAAPGLVLEPELVRRLAAARTSLGIRLESLEIGRAVRATRARREGRTNSQVSVHLLVRGDFEPDVFTNRIGIHPTSTVRKEQPRRLMARFDTWKYKIGPLSVAHFPAWAADQLLEQLLPRANAIRAAVGEFSLRSSFTFSAACEDVAPTLLISPGQLAGITELETHLEFAVTVVRENETFLEF